MPYANREEQLAAMRKRYAERYASDPKFRKAERQRKAKYYADNPAYARRVKRKATIGKSSSRVSRSHLSQLAQLLRALELILKKLDALPCKCLTPAVTIAGDMEQQLITLIRQLADCEGVTPEKLLWGLLPIVDRCQTVHDTCKYEKETQQQRQPPVKGSRGQKPLATG